MSKGFHMPDDQLLNDIFRAILPEETLKLYYNAEWSWTAGFQKIGARGSGTLRES